MIICDVCEKEMNYYNTLPLYLQTEGVREICSECTSDILEEVDKSDEEKMKKIKKYIKDKKGE